MITLIGEILVDQFITENGASNALGGAPFNVAAAIKRSGIILLYRCSRQR